MLNIKFQSDQETHECVPVQDGDWVIFKCSQCDYTRKLNLKTGKSSSNGGDWKTLHEGSFSGITEDSIPVSNFSDN